MEKEKENKTLVCFYKTLPKTYSPKTQFIKRVAERCDTAEQTVRLWVKGRTKPSDAKFLAILEEETGISRENLFNHD